MLVQRCLANNVKFGQITEEQFDKTMKKYNLKCEDTSSENGFLNGAKITTQDGDTVKFQYPKSKVQQELSYSFPREPEVAKALFNCEVLAYLTPGYKLMTDKEEIGEVQK